jgi:acyl-CoA thioesterase-2
MTLELLELEQIGENRYAVPNEGDPSIHNVVFGGQLLAQMIMAATRHSDGKYVKTINAIFARAGRVDGDTEIEVETIHSGRAFASHTVTVWQNEGRLCARANVLAHVDEADVINHDVTAPPATPPDPAQIRVGGLVFPTAEVAVADNVDLVDSSAPARPAELNVWLRSTETPDERTVNQAVLAWATDGFLIGTAMLPHEGIGQDRAHVDLSTGVLDHTLTFHKPFSLQDWVLMAHESPFAGAGRSYGRCHIFDAEGSLVASYVQDNMIRAMPDAMTSKRM